MVETKFINRKSFTATNTVCSAATITVLVLCLSAAQGENLTTLDGKTYTNITDISKYPKQVYFNCDSNRIGIAITNLPEDFLAKHGVKPAVVAGQLLKAERAGDIEIIKTLLKNGVDINSKETADGTTALIWAAVEGHVYMVKLFLDNGANVNARNNVGMTALMGAAFIGQTNEIDLLLDKGADINAKQNDGKTALMFAAGVGNIEAVKILLARGAVGGEAAVVQLQAWLDNASGKSVSAGVASDRPVLQSTNPVDVFLANHQNSSLEVERQEWVNIPGVKSNGSCLIRVTAKFFEMEAFEPLLAGLGEPHASTSKISFAFGQEVVLEQVFEKFVEWEDLARKNNAESFQKNIPYSTGKHNFTFDWRKDFSGGPIATLWFNLADDDDVRYAREFSKEDVAKLSKFLSQLPALKQELMQKIQNQEAQKTLFK